VEDERTFAGVAASDFDYRAQEKIVVPGSVHILELAFDSGYGSGGEWRSDCPVATAE
jgi:hypothetical protein